MESQEYGKKCALKGNKKYLTIEIFAQLFFYDTHLLTFFNISCSIRL